MTKETFDAVSIEDNDIDDIRSNERVIEILHPRTREPVGIRVTIVSVDDEKLSKLKRSIQDRRMYLEARGKTFKAEEIEENGLNLKVAAMTGWEWYAPEGKKQANYKGRVPDFTRKDVTEVLTEKKWFGDQINTAIGETEAFFDKSSPS